MPIAPKASLSDENVCIIGLGYVGLTLATAMANAGFRIYGVERSQHICDCVSAGKAHFFEANLDAPLSRHVNSGRLTCSQYLPQAGEASVYIITVGTPLGKDGKVNLTSLREVLRGVASILRDGDLVILRSTVKTGTTRQIAKAELDKAGKAYDLAFCPERTLEGKALEELSTLPQVVGGMTEAATERAARLFNALTPEVTRVASPEAAELTKLINNTQRDLMFAFANEVAEICDAVEVPVTEVIHAATHNYPRSRIALPGPVGGPCLEKDPHILAEGLSERGYLPSISLMGRRLNEKLPETSIAQIGKKLETIGVKDSSKVKISILGLAFKGAPETNDLRGTMAEHILRAARTRWPDARYCAFDPIVPKAEFGQFSVEACDTLEEAFDEASLVLIQNNHRAFAKMPLLDLSARMRAPALIYDFWNLFDKRTVKVAENRFYGGLGTLFA